MYICKYKITVSNSNTGQELETFEQKSPLLPREIQSWMAKKYPTVGVQVTHSFISREFF